MLVPDDADKTESAACHVTVAMMDEWDAFNRSFRCAVHAHSDSGELDLGDAPSHPFSAVDIFNLLLLHLVCSCIPCLRSVVNCPLLASMTTFEEPFNVCR